MKIYIILACLAILTFCFKDQVYAQTLNSSNQSSRNVRRQANVSTKKITDSTVRSNKASAYQSNSTTRKTAKADSAIADGAGKTLYQQSAAVRKSTLQTNSNAKKVGFQSNSQNRRTTLESNKANRQ